MPITRIQIQKAPCPKCGASAYRPCVRRVPAGLFKVTTFPRQHSHQERLVEARAMTRPASRPTDPPIAHLLG